MPLTLMLKISSSLDLLITAAQILVEYDRIDDDGGSGDNKMVEMLSKVKKSQRPKKL